MDRRYFYIIIIFGWLAGAVPGVQVFSQTPAAEQRYLEERFAPAHFKEERWQKATRGLEYTLQPRKPDPKKKQAERGSGGRLKPGREGSDNSGNAAAAFKFIAVVFLAALAGFLIYQLTRGARNKKIKPTALRLFAEQMEGDLPNEGLESYLREAERQGQYALAIRFFYLSVLQALQDRQLIRWKKDKTNRAYVMELRQMPFAEGFRNCTRIFDKVRYGEYFPEEAEYRVIAALFRQLLQQIGGYHPKTSAVSTLNPAAHD